MATTTAPKLSDYTTAQLTAAANKYIGATMDATYNAATLLSMAKSDPTLARKIMNYVPGVSPATTSPSGTKTTTPTTTPTTPTTITPIKIPTSSSSNLYLKSSGVTSGGISYTFSDGSVYLQNAAGTISKINTTNPLAAPTPVASLPTVMTSSAQPTSSMPTNYAAPTVAPSAPAVITTPLAVSKGFTLPDPNAQIAKVMSGKGTDTTTDSATGNSYHLVATSPTTAQWYVISNNGTQAKLVVNPTTAPATTNKPDSSMTTTALNTAVQNYYKTNPTEPMKVAQAKEAELNRQNLITSLNTSVAATKNINQLTEYLKQAKSNNVSIDPNSITSAEKTLLSDDTNISSLVEDLKQFQNAGLPVDSATLNSSMSQVIKSLDDVKTFNTTAKLQNLTVSQPIINQLANTAAGAVKSFADLKSLNDQIRSLGGIIDQSVIDKSINNIGQTSGATTRQSLAKLQADAAAAGFKPSQTFIDQQNAVIAKAEQDAAAFAAANAGAIKAGFTDNAAQQKFMAANQASIDWATNSLIKKGFSAADAAATVADVVKNYNQTVPGDMNRFNRALESAVYSPESYAKFKQTYIPAAQSAATQALNAQLYDTKTGDYAKLTQDQLNEITQKARDQGLPINQAYVDKIQTQLTAAAQAETQKQAQAQQNIEFQKTLPQPGSKDFGYYVTNGYDITGPGGYSYHAMPADKTTGAQGYWVVDRGDKNYTTLTGDKSFGNLTKTMQAANDVGKINSSIDRLIGLGVDQATASKIGAQGYDAAQKAISDQMAANQAAENAKVREANAQLEAYAASRRPDYNADTGFSFLDKLALVGFVAAAAAPLLSSLGSSAAAALSEGSAAAAGLAQGGMSLPEVAATLEASGIPTAAADVMAESAVAATSGTVNAATALASNGITPEVLAMANATADPIAALTAAQGWTAVDTAYLASIGAPAAVIATAEATNVAMGLPASTVGSTATAEVAGTAPAGSTAEVAASQPVAPATPAAPAPAAPLTELNAQQTAEIMKGVDPNMVNGLQPGAAGSAGGTAGATTAGGIPGETIFSGDSINPIRNALVNSGITNPTLVGALTGAATSGAINILTGKPITVDDLLLGAVGGGTAGAIGTALPNPGSSILQSAINGIATNVGGSVAVNLISGRPITADNLAMAAIVGGTIGAGAHVIGQSGGTTTYRYDDGSYMIVDSAGKPITVVDSTGAVVPLGTQNTGTGKVTPGATPNQPPPGSIPVQAQDGTILYTDGQNYYTEDGTLTDITNPTPGGATTTAKLSPDNQKTVTDTTDDYLNGKLSWDEAAAKINQAVRDDINSGYLTDNGDGTYTAPDGVTYFMNNETGMYDTRVGQVGGTGFGGGPVQPDQIPTVIPPAQPAPPTAEQPPTTTVAEQPVQPTPIEQPPVTQPPVELPPPTVVAEAPGGGTTEEPVNPYVPPTTTGGGEGGTGQIPISSPIQPTPIEQPPVEQPPVAQPPVEQPPVAQPPVEQPPIQPPVEQPPVEQPPTQPPVEQPPVEQPPTQPVPPTEPPYVAPPIYVPPIEVPTPKWKGWGPITPLDWGAVPNITAQGLNPGWITNVPAQYPTQNLQQSKFYWGQKPFQAGTTFNPELYKQSGAPARPWGLQQMYTPMNINEYIARQQAINQAAIAPAPVPTPVLVPVKPT